MSNLNTFDFNQFNALIKQANESISCDATCMQNQKKQELTQRYLDAETNVVSAPQQLTTTLKDLITFTQGENGYNTYIDKELQNKADTIINTFKTKFNSDANTVISNIKKYAGILLNFNNIFDLYKKYKIENDELEKKLKITSSDTLTNDRKSYYQDEGLIRIRNYYYFFLFVYIFIVVVFILSMFLVKTDVKISIRIFILFLLIIYPFVCLWLFRLFEYVVNNIIDSFPKNIYKNL
jgi:hypothetical protein